MKNSRVLEVAFSIALLAYPAAFRRRFGPEMRKDFEGHGGQAMSTIRSLGNFVAAGLAERGTAVTRFLFWPNSRPHLYAPSGRHHMFWDSLRSDLQHTVRLAIKTPVFTALTVVALALGIGANSAIFAVINAVLLRPLPYAAADRLVMLWSDVTLDGRHQNPLSPANFLDFQKMNQTLEGLEAYFTFLTPQELVFDSGREVAFSVVVTPRLITLLGGQPVLGRTFAPEDVDAVILSHGYWQRRFGGDPTIIGRSIQMASNAPTVVGVMPASFVFPYPGMLGPSGFTRVTNVDMWVPMTFSGPRAVSNRMLTQAGQPVRDTHWLGAIGRLRPGKSVDEARTDLNIVARQLEQSYPEANKGWAATVVAAHDQTVGSIRNALLVLMAGVGFVLIMAAVNVANLILARSISRHKELATRAALGARRGRLVQQALTESLLFAFAGGLVGLLLMRWGIQVLVALAPPDLPRIAEVTPDWRVIGATLAVTIIAGVLVGVLPALSAAGSSPQAALQEYTRGAIGGGTLRRRARAALVVAEVALAVMLTVGAGLLLRSFVTLLNVDPGFQSEHLLTWQMNVPRRLQTPDQRRAFYAEFFRRMESLPGVQAVGGTTRLPLGSTSVSTTIDVEGRPLPAGQLPEVQFRRNLHNYLQAMGIPIVRGRGFTNEDGPTAPSVAVVNQTLARQLFPGADAVGQHVRMGTTTGPWTTIVGIIGDVRHSGLEKIPEPELYIHSLQNPPVNPFIVIRSAADPASLMEAARAEARAMDKELPVYDMRTMLQVRSESVSQRRFVLLLVSAFGLLALVLAAVGVYGVMALIVSERTQEVGIRLALGAHPGSVMKLVVSQAAKLAGLGAIVGAALALPLTPLMASQLYGVRPSDPWTFVGVPLALVGVAIIAAVVPARRAMRVDPVEALRYQ